jgi:hypothetical protein
VQNGDETVTKTHITDYTSMANRDILVIEDGSWMQRWLYGATGSRLSVEIAYADGTACGETNAGGEFGENFASDFAVNEIAKGWYRANLLGTTPYVHQRIKRQGDYCNRMD